MKGLIISTIIFILICAAMFANFIYVNKTADKLSFLAHSLTLDSHSEHILNEIDSRWKKASLVFSLSVNSRDINAMDELLLSLRSAYQFKKEYEFEIYKALLIDSIEDLRRLERFSSENIF